MKKSINPVLGVSLLFVALVIAIGVVIPVVSQVASYDNVQEVSAQERTERLNGWMWNGAYECSTFNESLDECEGEPANVGLGWISLNCENHDGCSQSDYGVEVEIATGDISGYAWASGYGWISFNETGDGPDGTDADMRIVEDKIVGWAKVLNMGEDGWIKFDEVPYDEGDIGDSGWAWNANEPGNSIDPDKWGFGWVQFIDAEGPFLELVPPEVDLVADPDYSDSAFSPDLIATVLEGYGPFEYSFKCDSDGQGEDINDWDAVESSSNSEYVYDGCTYGADGESGMWTPWVKVEDRSRLQGFASARVTICTPDDPACNLIGCYAEADAYDDGTSNPVRLDEESSVTIGTPVTWIAELRSTADPITSGFSWSWVPPMLDWEEDDGNEVDVVYETVGIKEGSVKSGGNSIDCDAGFRVIVDPEFEEF